MMRFKKEILLYQYQEDYYSSVKKCLSENKGVLLCLDTGMGKTYIGTKFIQDILKDTSTANILVLARKKNLDDPWGNLFEEEMALITQEGKRAYFVFSKAEADKLRPNSASCADFSDFNVILANYDVVAANINDFRYIDWDLIVYDEIHELASKVKERKILKKISNLNVHKQIGLTASPMRNSMKELFILNKFIQDNKNINKVYKELEERVEEFSKKASAKGGSKNLQGGLEDCEKDEREHLSSSGEKGVAEDMLEASLAEEIRKYLGKTIFYFSKRDERIPQLKPLINRSIFLPLLLTQSAWYHLCDEGENIKKLWKNKAVIVETSPMAAKSKGEICIKEAAGGISTKEVFLMQLVKQIIENTDDKIVIFSQFTTILAYFLRKLMREEYNCVYIDGSSKDYLERIEKFRMNKDIRIILSSLSAYKEGIDLRCANHVVFLDLPYNPQVLAQAKDRCHRTGQEKNVFAYYLIYHCDFLTPDTIRIKYLRKKNERFNALFGYDRDGGRLPEFVSETYKFSYIKPDDQITDMKNKYAKLRMMLDFTFLTNEFTGQFNIYLNDMKEVRQDERFGLYAEISDVCHYYDDKCVSVFNDMDFSGSAN